MGASSTAGTALVELAAVGVRDRAAPAATSIAPVRARQDRAVLLDRPAPDGGPKSALEPGRLIAALIVLGPVLLVALMVAWWAPALHARDVVLGVVLYLVSSYGITVGFHRLFTHRGFTAKRPLKIALAVAGSLAIQGSVVGWVANHRRHHVYSDQPGDPHSPVTDSPRAWDRLSAFAHAHAGWLFGGVSTPVERYAADVARDPDLRLVSRLFPALALASLALPFVAGWALSGTLAGAVSALVWAGVIRMAAAHHVTWSVNSVCHTFGRRPYVTTDRSTNFMPLALVSLGESWHNFHHAMPSSPRHGVGRHQIDSSAGLIRLLERAGWATGVRWPTPAQIDARLVRSI